MGQQQQMSAAEAREMFKRKNASRNGKTSSGANALTKEALKYLNSSGFCAWRNNTTGIFDPAKAAKLLMAYIRCVVSGGRTPESIHRIVGHPVARGKFTVGDLRKLLASSFRKHHGMKGIPDIIGYEWKDKTGRMIGIEVKHGKDKESKDQKSFRMQAQRRGVWVTTIRNMDDLIEWLDEVKPLANKQK